MRKTVTAAMTSAALAVLIALLPAQVAPEAMSEGDEGPGGAAAACELPAELRLRNTGGMGPRGPGSGAGLCVFTSVEHCGRYQNVPELYGFQKWMTTREGGGYPEKVDRMMREFAPGVDYLQHVGGDVEWLKAALKTGRPVAVTYCGLDPRYGRQVIAHMANLLHLDDRIACVLDNNFPERCLWMSAAEFVERWLGEAEGGRKHLIRGRPVGGGWAVVVLHAPPPPAPKP